jgi:hypothetical protein
LSDGDDQAVAPTQNDGNTEAPPEESLAAESLDADLAGGRPSETAAVSSSDGLGGSSTLLAPDPRPPLLSLGGSAMPSGRRASARAGVGRRGAPRLAELAERATVTVFGAVGEGSRFVYLFDRSTSMTGAPLAAAKQQLIASLDALSRIHQFQVIFFNDQVQAWDLTGGQNRVPFASDANKQLAAQFVRSVTAAGGTDRLTPLRRALDMNVDVVFFLTDADDAMPSYDVADVIERAQSTGTAIACIEFGDGPQPRERQNFLTRLAAETGGDYVYVDVTKLGSR